VFTFYYGRVWLENMFGSTQFWLKIQKLFFYIYVDWLQYDTLIHIIHNNIIL